jgi:hypothetical protein
MTSRVLGSMIRRSKLRLLNVETLLPFSFDEPPTVDGEDVLPGFVLDGFQLFYSKCRPIIEKQEQTQSVRSRGW